MVSEIGGSEEIGGRKVMELDTSVHQAQSRGDIVAKRDAWRQECIVYDLRRLVPAPLQLARHQAIGGINSITPGCTADHQGEERQQGHTGGLEQLEGTMQPARSGQRPESGLSC